jgi:Zn-dependent metalloprotease
MSNISQCPCGVIPPHILRRIAGAADADASSTARDTLQEMHLIAQQREQFLISKDPYEQAPAVAKQRNVYDAQHHRSLPGKRVRSESDSRSTDVEVNEAFDGSGVTIDFYKDIFDRDSIDGSGMPVNSTVHYGKNFDNALWNGSQMVYGDGDGKLFKGFTPAIDVIGHELTHGVTQFTAMLEYSGQSGALNEHISDAFGIMVKQYALGLTARQSNWLIGEGLFAPGVKGKALRSMAAPGTAYDDPRLGHDPQPARMHDYVVTEDDGGGVHINSGIPNHAFYLAAMALGGNTWDVLGKVWYAALTEKTEPDAQFRDFANATVVAAGELYGIAGTVQKAIAAAWAKVGLAVRSRFAAAPKWRRRPAVSRPQASDRKKGEAS